MNIFIDEKENILESISSYNLDIDLSVLKKLKFISDKQSNNYIGYFQFKTHNKYVKIYVLPKITPKINNDDETNIANFHKFLQKYYNIKDKYNFIKPKIIDSNIIDLNFSSIENLILTKYQNSLKVIFNFFKKHKKHKYIDTEYLSQSIKGKLNISKNIIEPNKSIIHQYKKEVINHSKLAFISSFAIKYFKKNILVNINDISNELHTSSKKSLNLINQKFNKDTNMSLNINSILSRKIRKLFKKNDEKLLLHSIFILLGMDEYHSNHKTDNMVSVFFRPEKLYELIVYDNLISNYQNYQIKADFKGETTTSYNLIGNSVTYKNDSQPDFIVESDDEIIIIDAKWKLLNDKPKLDDTLKLERDLKVIESIKNKKAYLYYPIININSNNFRIDYSDFTFSVKEVY